MASQESARISAQFVSVWDGGLELVSACSIDPLTGEVAQEPASYPDNLELNVCEGEVIRLGDGTEFQVVDVSGKLIVADLAALQNHTLIANAAACDDLDDSARVIQNAIGQDDGGLAGMFFADFEDIESRWPSMSLSERHPILKDYLAFELRIARNLSQAAAPVKASVPAGAGAGATPVSLQAARQVANIYRLTFSALCPSDGEEIEYKLEIKRPTILMVEHLKAEIDCIKTGYQEDIAAFRIERFGGEQRMVATHQGVEIETYRKA